MVQLRSERVDVDGLSLHYVEAGTGPPVLLLHGWPTSSLLWRNIMPAMAAHNRVIALDLPGFGRSDKPIDVSYSFRFYARILSGFVDAIGVDALGLAVHDLGGPVGLYWACHNRSRITHLALLNTLVYPQVSWAVVAFGIACRLPGVREWGTSKRGLEFAMRLGMAQKSQVTAELLDGVQRPFVTKDDRRALLKTALGLSPKGLKDIQRMIGSFDIPVRIVYGDRDRILPDVAKTMRRVASDLPQAKTTVLHGCGHFLQEDEPQRVAELLSAFFAG